MSDRSTRAPATKFQPGHDPRRYHAGRKKGAVSAKTREQYEEMWEQARMKLRAKFIEEAEEVTDVIIEQAKTGDPRFCKMILDTIMLDAKSSLTFNNTMAVQNKNSTALEPPPLTFNYVSVN
jgi:hypothetical protein